MKFKIGVMGLRAMLKPIRDLGGRRGTLKGVQAAAQLVPMTYTGRDGGRKPRRVGVLIVEGCKLPVAAPARAKQAESSGDNASGDEPRETLAAAGALSKESRPRHCWFRRLTVDATGRGRLREPSTRVAS